MSNLTKILINNSGENIQILNREVSDQESYLIPYCMWNKLADDTNIPNLIDVGSIVVNDGTRNLEAELAKRHIKLFNKPSLTSTIFTRAGTLLFDEWISYNEITPLVDLIIPEKCVVKYVTWSNNYTNRTFSLECYKNGTELENICGSISIEDSEDVCGYFSNLDIILNAGDKIQVKYKASLLNNADDLVLSVYTERF